MVILNKIYTKTGDDGTTALGNGLRVHKFDVRVDAYGTVDETNASIGVARLQLTSEMIGLNDMLGRVQNDLFDLGADLATPESDEKLEFEPLRVIESQISRLESEIDELNANLSPLRSFVLPGGSPAAASLHVSRTIARRAERLIVQTAQDASQRINPHAITYMNRLSDFLFVAARVANDDGKNDVLWVPGDNR